MMPKYAVSVSLVLIAALAAAPGQAAGGQRVPFEPDAIEIPDGLSQEIAIDVVLRALVVRSWRITNVAQQGRVVDAELPVRAHVARIRAIVDDRRVRFAYRKSDNVDHGWRVENTMDPGTKYDYVDTEPSGDATEVVHRNFLAWVQKLARTIEGMLLLEARERAD